VGRAESTDSIPHTRSTANTDRDLGCPHIGAGDAFLESNNGGHVCQSPSCRRTADHGPDRGACSGGFDPNRPRSLHRLPPGLWPRQRPDLQSTRLTPPPSRVRCFHGNARHTQTSTRNRRGGRCQRQIDVRPAGMLGLPRRTVVRGPPVPRRRHGRPGARTQFVWTRHLVRHAAPPRPMGDAPNLRDATATTLADVLRSREGHDVMGRITDEEVVDLIAFLRSLN
jgi:hypothetical protein